jgi:transcriptional regulator with XRE-family HTH domain
MPQSPHPVDVHVGKCIRYIRREREVTQAVLATRLGVSFQQVQKYESAANRVSASRLFQIAEVFGVPVSWFYDGLEGPGR